MLSWSSRKEHTLSPQPNRGGKIPTTHTPKPLLEFGANLPHQRLSIVKIFCLISVSPSMREQKQQRGRNVPPEPVVSTSFIIYPKHRVGFVPGSLSFWKSPDSQGSRRALSQISSGSCLTGRMKSRVFPSLVLYHIRLSSPRVSKTTLSPENPPPAVSHPSRQRSTHPLLTLAPYFTICTGWQRSHNGYLIEAEAALMWSRHIHNGAVDLPWNCSSRAIIF